MLSVTARNVFFIKDYLPSARLCSRFKVKTCTPQPLQICHPVLTYSYPEHLSRDLKVCMHIHTLSGSCFKTVFVPTSNNPHTSLNNYWKTSVLQRKRFYSPAAALNRLCTSTGVCSRRALSELPFVACSVFSFFNGVQMPHAGFLEWVVKPL